MKRTLRILVTGGAGLIGSHLCERLLDDGHAVTVLDDFSSGSRENVAALRQFRRFEVVEHDVAQPFHFDVDRIYNLASPASPVHYQKNPVRTVMTNVLGTYHGLQNARFRKARFLQASTSEVYGDPLVHPQSEAYNGNVNPIGVRACYDEGKRCAETLIMDFARQHGVSVRLARIFNTYGPRMSIDDGRVVSNFVVQALRDQDLTVYGDGQQTRSFCYVTDLVDGLVALMEHPSESGPVNIGNPTEFTVLDLAHRVIRLTGSASRIIRRPLPSDDPRQRRPNIARARAKLGYSPTVELEEGLRHTVAYFREMLRAEPAHAKHGAGAQGEGRLTG
jgi:UDP-glucuronate decarboxylase